MGDRVTYCPRAQSDYTPCIARDGRTALTDDGMCVGCIHGPTYLLKDLSKRYPPAGLYVELAPEKAADKLTACVEAYIKGKGKDIG